MYYTLITTALIGIYEVKTLTSPVQCKKIYKVEWNAFEEDCIKHEQLPMRCKKLLSSLRYDYTWLLVFYRDLYSLKSYRITHLIKCINNHSNVIIPVIVVLCKRMWYCKWYILYNIYIYHDLIAHGGNWRYIKLMNTTCMARGWVLSWMETT